MTFFESLLVLLAIAILLLQISRRLTIPYPAMLAAAGVVLALVPGAPRIGLDPHTALALFIAPALVDAAFDFPNRRSLAAVAAPVRGRRRGGPAERRRGRVARHRRSSGYRSMPRWR
jgi:hypothetical protein